MAALALYRAGKVTPVVSEHFTLDQAPVAIARLESRVATAKIVVTIN